MVLGRLHTLFEQLQGRTHGTSSVFQPRNHKQFLAELSSNDHALLIIVLIAQLERNDERCCYMEN
jgi:hypothetical protein